MTAEQVLVGLLDRLGWNGQAAARALFTAHAGELAEEQREWCRSTYDRVIAQWGADRARDWAHGILQASDRMDKNDQEST